MDTLNSQIEQSRQAAVIVAEQDRLRAQANLLPELEREKQKAEARAAAQAEFESAMQETREAMKVNAAKATELRERFTQAVAELTSLCDEAVSLTRQIKSVAASLKAKAEIAGYRNFFEVWDAVGGHEDALRILPKWKDIPPELRDFIEHRKALNAYHPKQRL